MNYLKIWRIILHVHAKWMVNVIQLKCNTQTEVLAHIHTIHYIFKVLVVIILFLTAFAFLVYILDGTCRKALSPSLSRTILLSYISFEFKQVPNNIIRYVRFYADNENFVSNSFIVTKWTNSLCDADLSVFFQNAFRNKMYDWRFFWFHQFKVK